MAPVVVDPAKVTEFASKGDFYAWLSKNHDTADEIWIRIFKKASGKPTITPIEAIDVVLCWGWIDAIKKSYDDESFVQRYTRRKKKSVWSQINRNNVARLVDEGEMTEHGLTHVEAAKADGRWDAAYTIRMAPPEDLLSAIKASPKALAKYETLSSQNRFALTFRTINLKTAAAREKKIAGFVAMLEKGETIYPQGKGTV
ncbi:MAG: YdeI/OmpD-associated family protein [Candidatus Devosia phytovorans]|uniref:YdeI/OmpD-associated family protein n=1 Tax=Candidatus Devosia phytovorans TaxID=3121372 RepID=A0AAJ6AZC2_9HYPH|nr:YdeI/OmpD-associated family protein [Devosia sp.]WEK03967.1 MAG: YdeI/OmpD-associated family protein [Devosia sp.]